MESRQQSSSPRRSQSPQPSNGEPNKRKHWFKRPSLPWILCMKALTSIAGAITSGPRVEIFTELVCRSYGPGHVESPGLLGLAPSTTTDTSVVLNATVSFIEVYFPHVNQLEAHSSRLALAPAQPSIPPGGCRSDPKVSAEVAKLSAVSGIIGGVLSCLTTGWWGGYLDRNGRTRTMGTLILAPLISDILLLVVFHFSHILPVNYWILLISPVVEGLFGVPSSAFTAETAYMRDISEQHNLARNFSLLVGIFYAGATIGPVLGGFINQRAGSVISAFYVTSAAHVTYAIIVWFALPEPLSESAMAHARTRYADELASVAGPGVGPLRRRIMVFIKAFWDSFPLNVLAPKRLPNSQRKRDWSLTWLAISAALINAVMGSATSVYQYALLTYRWSSLELGYFISALGLSTVIFLTAILPGTISLCKRVPRSRRHAEAAKYSTLFDLNLLRVSSLLFAAGYGLMGIAPTGLIFTLSAIVSTLGEGFLPTVQSVAAIIHTSVSGEDDTGRLFGALGVVYVVGGRIVGPALYGTLYINTVAFFPSAIFWLATGCSVTVFLLLAFIRLPHRVSGVQDPEQRRSDSDSELDPLLDG